MGRTTAVTLTAILAALAVLFGVAALALTGGTWTTPHGDAFNPPAEAIGFTLAALITTTVGAMLAIKRPENPIGWFFLIDGVFGAVDIAFERYLLYTLVETPSSQLPNLAGAGGLTNGLWIIPMTCTVLVLMTFPLGRTISRPWTWAARMVVLLASVAMVLTLIEPGPFAAPLDAYQNKLSIEAYADYTFLFSLIILVIAAIALVAAGSLFRRFLRSHGDEHEQLKWFLYVVAWLPLLVISYVVTDAFGISTGIVFELLSLATIAMIASLPVAIGIAVMKYRLYDIDLLVNRTLVYVPLTAILAGIFSASTALTRTLFTELSGEASDAAVAATTIAIVGLFTPVKNQLQAFVDRLFKEPSDPVKPLKTLAADARKVFAILDAEGFLQEFADRTANAMGAASAFIYLNGQTTPVIVSGDPLAAGVLSFPLVETDTHVGRLDIGPSKAMRPFTIQQVSAIEAQTDVLARGLVFYAAANGLKIERPDQTGPGVAESMIGAL